MAGVDLREIVGAMRVATDLERTSATLPRTWASGSPALENEFQPLKLIRGLEHMTDLVRSAGEIRARRLCGARFAGRDDGLEGRRGGRCAICTSLFRELLTYMMEDPRNISFCIHLMFCAKNIERIGDHATNIAETVFYMIEGSQQDPRKAPEGRP